MGKIFLQSILDMGHENYLPMASTLYYQEMAANAGTLGDPYLRQVPLARIPDSHDLAIMRKHAFPAVRPAQ